MEYEIEDEQVLFDESTNPSLKERKRQSVRNQPPAPGQARRKRQKAVVIPEEEEQTVS